jgi:hypothetical protein
MVFLIKVALQVYSFRSCVVSYAPQARESAVTISVAICFSAISDVTMLSDHAARSGSDRKSFRRGSASRYPIIPHETYLVADEFVGDRNALLWLGGVIAGRDDQLLAQNAARCVEGDAFRHDV